MSKRKREAQLLLERWQVVCRNWATMQSEGTGLTILSVIVRWRSCEEFIFSLRVSWPRVTWNLWVNEWANTSVQLRKLVEHHWIGRSGSRGNISLVDLLRWNSRVAKYKSWRPFPQCLLSSVPYKMQLKVQLVQSSLVIVSGACLIWSRHHQLERYSCFLACLVVGDPTSWIGSKKVVGCLLHQSE